MYNLNCDGQKLMWDASESKILLTMFCLWKCIKLLLLQQKRRGPAKKHVYARANAFYSSGFPPAEVLLVNLNKPLFMCLVTKDRSCCSHSFSFRLSHFNLMGLPRRLCYARQSFLQFDDSPYYVFVALCIVVIVVSLIKIASSNENIECFYEYFAVSYRAPDPSFF
jgi:hypothetical protein